MIGLEPQLLGVAPGKAIKLTVTHCISKHVDIRMHIHADGSTGLLHRVDV